MTQRTDILIVGGGLVGASLALALDAGGRGAVLLEAAPARTVPAANEDDNDRNLVLARASVNALKALQVWPHLEAAAGTPNGRRPSAAQIAAMMSRSARGSPSETL